MQRRGFLTTSAALVAGGAWASRVEATVSSRHPLKFAARVGMFKHLAGESLSEQIAFAAAQGFAAFEYRQLLRRSQNDIEKYSLELSAHNMTWGAACVWEEYSDSVLNNDRKIPSGSDFNLQAVRTVDCAYNVQELKSGVIVPGRLERGISRSRHFDRIEHVLYTREAERLGFTYVLQPRQHLPGATPMLLETVEDAAELCERMNSPAVKILYDVYEQTMNGRDVAEDVRRYQRHIGYLHVGDAPGNKEPGTGKIRFDSLFAQLREQCFEGGIGLDHGHSRPGIEGELAVLEAHRRLLA